MARLRNVHLYPYSGWPDRPWRGGQGAAAPLESDVLDRDAAARSARAVTEGLSAELGAAQIDSRRAVYRIMLSDTVTADAVEVKPLPGLAKDGFVGRVQVSAGFRRLLPAQRAEALAEAVYQCLLPLAQTEGWDAELGSALDRVRANAYGCTWRSAWKRTRNRDRSVRIAAEIAEDGYGRWRVEIDDGDEVELRATPWLFGWTWLQNFERMAKGMRFVEADRLMVGRGSMVLDTVTTIDIASGEVVADVGSAEFGVNPVPLSYPGEPGLTTPPIRMGPSPDFMMTGGYGPLSREVDAYHSEAVRLDKQLRSEAWDSWWRGVGVPEVELSISYSGQSAKVSVRLAGNRLAVRRYRPPESVPRDVAAAADAARADVEAMVETVRKRFKLPTPPSLSR